MANLQATSSPEAVTGLYQHDFEMQEAPRTTTTNNDDDDNDDDNNQVYPTGAKRWLALSSLLFCAALHGLDLTIIAAQMLGVVSSPVVGGALIDWLGTWRGCFGVNLPLDVLAIVFVVLDSRGMLAWSGGKVQHHVKKDKQKEKDE